jgi:hypothetical protein
MIKALLLAFVFMASPVYADYIGDFKLIKYDDPLIKYKRLPPAILQINQSLFKIYNRHPFVGPWYIGFRLLEWNPITKDHPTTQATYEIHFDTKQIKYGVMTTSPGGIYIAVFDTKAEFNEALWDVGLDDVNWRIE